MPLPLRLTAADLGSLQRFLNGLSVLTAETGWRVGAYGPFEIDAETAAGTQTIRIDGPRGADPIVYAVQEYAE